MPFTPLYAVRPSSFKSSFFAYGSNTIIPPAPESNKKCPTWPFTATSTWTARPPLFEYTDVWDTISIGTGLGSPNVHVSVGDGG